MFYGRKNELEKLENEYLKPNSLCSIYGLKKIGKTSLINEFIKDKKCIMFQAKEVSNKDNLKSFSYKILESFNRDDEYPYSTWEKAFDAAISFFKNEKGVIVIDEYPYLVKSYNGITSIIQDVFDNKIKNSNIMLILSGSNLSFMERELNDKQSPLYKRTTLKMKINKLPFDEAILFLQNYSNEDKMKFLCMFGEYPYYLSKIDNNLSFEDNVKHLLFNENSILLDVPKLVLSNSSREQGFYNSILLALAGKKKGLTEISTLMNEETTKVNKYIKTLIDAEIIIKKEMFNLQRQTYYYIVDPILRFYYKYLLKNIDKIEAGYGLMLYERLKDDINQFISYSFEDISISYMEYLGRKGKLNGIYYPIQNLIIEKSELGRSIEIDGIAKDGNSLIVIECKYTNDKRTIKDFEKMKENTSIKMFASIKKIEYYILSKSGFDESLLNIKDDNLHLISLDDMFSI
ncbi:MAG: ATP-binding protein [Candidatus Caccosoma sp.]|nr:ATP-binding protein [Candidatus Caccosoma sp.]